MTPRLRSLTKRPKKARRKAVRVFLDENMPRPLRQVLQGHVVSFVEREGWKGKQNGELLALVEASFDVLVTSDSNMAFQNSLVGRTLSIIVLPTNNLTLLRANAVGLRTAVDELAELDHSALVVVDWKGGRTLRRLDDLKQEDTSLPPVSPFKR
ncbi:DUF5615 family PIN-like protein [Jiella sp. M17.18]|uniref:DUF5615 family PIN-like protein n=1 Tax=Jiella sp. M17.18 TaxID=3234247 RepID=UPI0034DF5DDA